MKINGIALVTGLIVLVGLDLIVAILIPPSEGQLIVAALAGAWIASSLEDMGKPVIK